MIEIFVVINSTSYDNRVGELLALPQLSEKGLVVEYWNVGRFTLKEDVRLCQVPKGVIYKEFDSVADLQKEITKHDLEKTIFNTYFRYSKDTYCVFRLLTRLNCQYFFCAGGCLPSHRVNRSFSTNAICDYKRVWNYIQNRIYQFIKITPLIKPATLYFKTCENATPNEGTVVDENTLYLNCNSSDWETGARAGNVEIDYKYIVFVDQNIPFHPDSSINGYSFPEETYFKELNKFFSAIEEKYSYPIIISAHPTSKKYESHDYFSGRRIIYNKTKDLIKNSEMVIVHFSTAMGFAVMYKKPLIFLNSSVFSKYRQFETICEDYSKVLGAQYVDTTTNIDSVSPSVNTKLYDLYKYTYLTNKDTESIPNCDVFYEVFRKFNISKR